MYEGVHVCVCVYVLVIFLLLLLLINLGSALYVALHPWLVLNFAVNLGNDNKVLFCLLHGDGAGHSLRKQQCIW